MAIKINGATVITNSRRGVFKSVNPGSYTTAGRPPGSTEGDVIYDTDEKNIFIWNGEDWVGAGGGAINNLNPAIPPFISTTGPETVVTNSDGKVQFSLNKSSWSSSLTIPSETVYYCDWTNDILSAAHDSQYETTIDVSYPNVGASQTIELKLKIDKLPDPFSFTAQTEVLTNVILTSNTISPLNSINAPTAIWGSTNASNAEIAIADGAWEPLPTAINTRYIEVNERIRVRHVCPNPGSIYDTTINIGYGTTAGEYETADFTTATQNAYIDEPTINTPTQGGFVDQNGITVATAAPTGLDFGNHNATSWQISKVSDFSTIYAESLNDTTNLQSWTASVETETEGETYYIRAKYYTDLGFESPWSDTRTCVGQKWYGWRMKIDSAGARAGHNWWDHDKGDGCGQGGNGIAVVSYLTYSSTAVSAPGTLSQNSSAAQGGPRVGTGRGGSGPGGPAGASFLNGVTVSIGGGGGGGAGGNNAGGGSGRADPQDGSSDSTPSNGGTGQPDGGSGGGGGVAGAGKPNGGGGGEGGMNYAPPVGTMISDWEIDSVSQTGSSYGNNNPSATRVTLYRKYKNGSWTQVGSFGNNYSGPVADLNTTFFSTIQDTSSENSVKTALSSLTMSEVSDLAARVIPNYTSDELLGMTRTAIEDLMAAKIASNHVEAN